MSGQLWWGIFRGATKPELVALEPTKEKAATKLTPSYINYCETYKIRRVRIRFDALEEKT